MNHSKKIRIAIAVISFILLSGVTVFAASYDSSEDPLISLSYLTNIFKPEIEQGYEERVAELEQRLKELENDFSLSESDDDPIVDTTLASGGNNLSESAQYEIVELSYGDALYAVTACDIMLRSGSAACIAPDASQGIADYTDGYEVYNDQSIVKNHMLLIPRGDGRGLKALSESVFVMVRGDYTIVKG